MDFDTNFCNFLQRENALESLKVHKANSWNKLSLFPCQVALCLNFYFPGNFDWCRIYVNILKKRFLYWKCPILWQTLFNSSRSLLKGFVDWCTSLYEAICLVLFCWNGECGGWMCIGLNSSNLKYSSVEQFVTIFLQLNTLILTVIMAMVATQKERH